MPTLASGPHLSPADPNSPTPRRSVEKSEVASFKRLFTHDRVIVVSVNIAEGKRVQTSSSDLVQMLVPGAQADRLCDLHSIEKICSQPSYPIPLLFLVGFLFLLNSLSFFRYYNH